MNIYKRVPKQVIAKPSAQSNDFVSLFSGLMQHNRKTIGANGGGNRLRGPLMKPIILDWLCSIFGQKILLWWRRAIAANRWCLRKTEGLRRMEGEGRSRVRGARQRCQSPRERHDTLSDEQRYKVVVSRDRRKRPLLAMCVCVRFPFMCSHCVCRACVRACVESSLVCVVCDRDG